MPLGKRTYPIRAQEALLIQHTCQHAPHEWLVQNAEHVPAAGSVEIRIVQIGCKRVLAFKELGRPRHRLRESFRELGERIATTQSGRSPTIDLTLIRRADAIPGPGEKCSPSRRNGVRNQPGIVFGFTPESRSASPEFPTPSFNRDWPFSPADTLQESTVFKPSGVWAKSRIQIALPRVPQAATGSGTAIGSVGA